MLKHSREMVHSDDLSCLLSTSADTMNLCVARALSLADVLMDNHKAPTYKAFKHNRTYSTKQGHGREDFREI